jgi:helix-turn-helix protein
VSGNPFDDLVEEIRRVVREELQAGPESLSIRPVGFLDVDGAAEYLSTTPGAVRAQVKRRQLPFHKTPQGRLLFSPTELEAHVRGEDAGARVHH